MKQTTAEWRASLKTGDQWFVARKSKSGSAWSLFRCEVTAMDRGMIDRHQFSKTYLRINNIRCVISVL